MDKEIYLGCSCGDMRHIAKLSSFGLPTINGEVSETFLEFCLNTYHPWYKRILIAFKYCFGYSRAGIKEYDCVLLNKASISKVKDFCEQVLNDTPR